MYDTMTEREFNELVTYMRFLYPNWDNLSYDRKKYYASRAGYNHHERVTRAPRVNVKHFRGSAEANERAMLRWENSMFERYPTFRILGSSENMEFPTPFTMEFDLAVTYSI